MTRVQEISEAVETGKMKKVPGLVQQALDEGVDALEILNDGLIGAMNVVGDKFKTGEIYVSEMLVAARGMKKGVKVLKPHLVAKDVTSRGKCIIATVEGDLHDIGKNLVAMMIESKGFEVLDLGVDVPPETIIKAVRDNQDCKLVALSALLTTTMPSLENTVKVLTEVGIKSRAKIIVGGAPITQKFADEIGADGYSPDAASAAALACSLVS